MPVAVGALSIAYRWRFSVRGVLRGLFELACFFQVLPQNLGDGVRDRVDP